MAPDIPGNTGSIGRTSLALQARLILIKPYGFDISEKAIRRAGLDYWKFVDLKEYDHFQDFLEGEGFGQTPTEKEKQRLSFFTKWGEQSYLDHTFHKGDYLIFGSETKGLPQEVTNAYKEQTLHFPMLTTHIRSLNLSNAATAASYEVYRQLIGRGDVEKKHLFAP
jgi:tRNA (cytidine/uridine-2'-O-)-methyltransferase